jgi:hypothetical protein
MTPPPKCAQRRPQSRPKLKTDVTIVRAGALVLPWSGAQPFRSTKPRLRVSFQQVGFHLCNTNCKCGASEPTLCKVHHCGLPTQERRLLVLRSVTHRPLLQRRFSRLHQPATSSTSQAIKLYFQEPRRLLSRHLHGSLWRAACREGAAAGGSSWLCKGQWEVGVTRAWGHSRQMACRRASAYLVLVHTAGCGSAKMGQRSHARGAEKPNHGGAITT